MKGWQGVAAYVLLKQSVLLPQLALCVCTAAGGMASSSSSSKMWPTPGSGGGRRLATSQRPKWRRGVGAIERWMGAATRCCDVEAKIQVTGAWARTVQLGRDRCG